MRRKNEGLPGIPLGKAWKPTAEESKSLLETKMADGSTFADFLAKARKDFGYDR